MTWFHWKKGIIRGIESPPYHGCLPNLPSMFKITIHMLRFLSRWIPLMFSIIIEFRYCWQLQCGPSKVWKWVDHLMLKIMKLIKCYYLGKAHQMLVKIMLKSLLTTVTYLLFLAMIKIWDFYQKIISKPGLDRFIYKHIKTSKLWFLDKFTLSIH